MQCGGDISGAWARGSSGERPKEQYIYPPRNGANTRGRGCVHCDLSTLVQVYATVKQGEPVAS
jgi:hypothetical protein